MGGQSIETSLQRIERAIARIDAATARDGRGDLAALQGRHARLREEARLALSGIDALIAAGQG